jgi:hypothetical protein
LIGFCALLLKITTANNSKKDPKNFKNFIIS